MNFKDIFSNPEKAQEHKEKSDEKELYSWLQGKVEDCRRDGSRVQNEVKWFTNTAYLMGFGDVIYDPQLGGFKSTSGLFLNPGKKSNIYVNKILPYAQNRLSRLTKSKPKYKVRPESNDAQDKESSRLSEQVLDMIWDNQAMQNKIQDLYMSFQTAGHSYLKCYWDSQAGKEILNPETGSIEKEGDIRIDLVSAFEVFPDPMAKSFEECHYLIHCKVRRLDYFKTHFDRGEEVKPESMEWLQSLNFESKINSMTQSGVTKKTQQPKDSAVEICYYEKATKKHPNGRLIIAANGIILADKELPVGCIPFVKFDDIVIPQKYYPEAIITHLRPIQDQYTRLIRKRAAWTNKLLAGKYIVPRGSNLMAEALDDQSGEVLEYDQVPGSVPPSALQIPVMPEYAYKEEDRLISQFDEVSGINETSRGVLPSSNISGVAMSLLVEMDETRLGVMARRNETCMANFFKIVLKYVQEFYQTPRLIKSLGKQMEYTIKEFVGADLRNNHDVIIVEGSTLPGSVTAKQERVLALLNQGLIGNPQDPKVSEKILSMLEFGDVSELWTDYGLDMAEAKRTIEDIESGEIPSVNEFDNHTLIFQEMNRYRKTDKFRALDAQKQIVFMDIMNQHVEMQSDLMNPQTKQDELELDSLEGQLNGALAGSSLPIEEGLPGTEAEIDQQVQQQGELV